MWKTVKLGEVCELIGGGTPSKKNADYYGGEIPWATVRDMHSEELRETELQITELGLQNSSSKVIPANNVVIASRVGLGKVCLLTQDTAINQDLRGVIPKTPDTVDVRYLFYWFKQSAQTIISAGRGATVHGVTLPFLKSLELPLPPLAEQQRIVAKLDAAFAEIDRAVASNKQLLEACRKTFKSQLRKVFQSTPKDWLNANLKDVAQVFDGPHATPKTVDEGPLFLGISSLQDGELILDKTRHVTEEDFIKWTKRVTPRANDFVFSYETRLGQGAIIPNALKCCLGRRMGLLRFNADIIDSRFFMYQYISPPYQEFLRSCIKEGATVDRLSIKEFPSFPLKYPSLAEQRSITASLDSLKEKAEALEKINEKKGALMITLKSAILTQELQPPQSKAA